MDNQRLLIWAAFGLLLWFTYQAWMRDYAPQPAAPATAPATQTTTDATAKTSADGKAPTASTALPELPELPKTKAAQSTSAGTPGPAAADQPPGPSGTLVHVRTDVLDVLIDTRGGTLVNARLPKYPVTKDQPDNLVTLLSTDAANLGLLQTGLRSVGGGAEPNHLALFKSGANDYALGDKNEVTVSLSWDNGQGISVVKQYRFERGSYIIQAEQTVINESGADWQGAAYAQIQRHSYEQDRSTFDVGTYSFHGPIVYDGEKSTKLKRDDLIANGPFSMVAKDGWLAMIQHHFLSAVIPSPDLEQHYKVTIDENVATGSMIGPTQTVAAGDAHTFATTLFVGPKLQEQLAQVTPTLKLTVDYGWLTIISGPLFWLLSKVESVLNNWGLAIILVTMMIKLAFYKLTQMSGRSMAKMREIQPRMKALQERYKDDRQALSQATMELYKREKINPALGCLPMLIQMPFFLAFYWVLLESVEMRQAPFFLWINDLSSKDPYFILPLIMGAAMFLQQRLNPTPADPIQARIMKIMPIAFTVFFAFFPAGLVLYWVTNTSMSIAQQWRINKVVEEENRKRRSNKKDLKKTGENKKGDKKNKSDKT